LRKLRWRLRIVRYGPALGRPLERLAFIFFARWTIVDELPPARRLKSSYLLFESNFDGSRAEYLDAFADRLPTRIAALWETCYGFAEEVERNARGARFPPGDFKRFVTKNELRVLHFYAAYPEATTRIVRQAVALADRLERRRGRVDDVAAALALGPAPEPEAWPVQLRRTAGAWWRNVTGRYGVRPVTLALPIAPERADEIVERLAALDQRDSPLAAVPGTHFARFALIPRELIQLGQPAADVLDGPYLLYTGNHDGRRSDHLGALAAAGGWIWDACRDSPGSHDPQELAQWLGAHAIATRYFVQGFPPRTVEQVKQLLRRRAEQARRIAEAGA
jgi:hypothetical protein